MSTKEKKELDGLINMLVTDQKNAEELQQLYPTNTFQNGIWQGRKCCLEQVINKLRTFQHHSK